MTLSSIMVHVDVECSGNTFLGAAVNLAEQFDAPSLSVSPLLPCHGRILRKTRTRGWSKN